VISTTIYLLDRREAGRDLLAAAERRLSLEDRSRHAGFEREARREQFLLGRALLRGAMSRATGAEPGAVEITLCADGRPRVVTPGVSSPRFSLSHSGDWVACAVHPVAAIGLDIECMDASRDLAGIAALSFDVDEQSWLLRQPALSPAFYQLWTGREALIKLAGELDPPLSEMRGSLVADGALVAAPAPSGGWYHTEVRPAVALSIMCERATSPPCIELVDASSSRELLLA
jgi:4'-phosphopantetheinyl transferase